MDSEYSSLCSSVGLAFVWVRVCCYFMYSVHMYVIGERLHVHLEYTASTELKTH